MVGGEQSFGDSRYGETAIADVLPVAPVDGSSMAEASSRSGSRPMASGTR